MTINKLSIFQIAGAVAFIFTMYSSRAATLPSGFMEFEVASPLSSPTAMQIASDGRVFICEQSGKIRVVKNGQLLATPFATFNCESEGDRGLTGIALHPDFPNTPYIYVYYTFPGVYSPPTAPAYNVVSRVTANGDVMVPGSETILFNITPLSSSAHHCDGSLEFGADGKLYVGVADNSDGNNAQSFATMKGKVLRINPDGTIPADNPFYNQLQGDLRAIWVLGIRNPYTMALQPGTGRFFINNVGNNTWEEINEAVAGGNYGWPTYEGYTDVPGYISPLYCYGHGSGYFLGCAITGGTFYNPPQNQFPANYVGTYFYTDLCGSWINQFDLATNQVNTFAMNLAQQPVYVKVAPDGSLYYISRGASIETGSLHCIQYAPALAPQVLEHPQNVSAWVGETVSFSVSAKGSPPLAYQWQRDGNDIADATGATYSFNCALADSGAKFRCKITNSYGTTTSNEALLTVTVNTPPQVTITAPAEGQLYIAGETLAFSATAQDAEDGELDASAFTWQVELVREAHIRPFLQPVSGFKSGAVVLADEGQPNPDVSYRFTVTVVDRGGATATAVREIKPTLVQLTLASDPPGAQLTLDGTPFTAPLIQTGVAGFKRRIAASSPQVIAGLAYKFVEWSDGGDSAHTIVTPEADATFTARFVIADPAQSPPSVGPIVLPPISEIRAGNAITFNAAATGLGNLTWNWDFGDGTNDSTPLATAHIYSAPGQYVLTVRVTDAYQQTAQATAVINVPSGDPVADSDGDGVTDAQEIADGTDPFNAASYLARALTVKTMQAQLFLSGGRDKISFDAMIDADVPPNGSLVGIVINGSVMTAIANSRGVAVAESVSVKMKQVKSKKVSGLLVSGRMSRGAWLQSWSNRFIEGRAAMDTNLIIQGRRYQQIVDSTYVSKNGQTKMKYKPR